MVIMEGFSMQRFWARYLILVGVLFFFSGIIAWVQFKQPQEKKSIDISEIPFHIGEWKAEEIPVDKQTKDILETENILMREYVNSKGEKILLAIVYYKDSRVALHLPESCLMGQGSRLTDRKPEKIGISVDNYFYANQIVTKSNSGNNLVLYYFETGSLRTNSYFKFRWQMLLNKLNGRSTGGALVRFSKVVRENSLTNDLETVKRFMKEMGELLPTCLI